LTFEKDNWTGTESQTPTPKIEIFLPSNTSFSRPDLTFLPDINAGARSKLQSYSFTESVDDLIGSFSFSTLSGEHEHKDIYDLIPIRTIIKIFEGGERAAFVGIIRRRRISKQMTAQGIKPVITFSGKSITSCVTEYMVSLDVRIYRVMDAVSKNKDLNRRLSETTSIKEFLKITWDHFKNISNKLNEERNGVTNTEIANIIERTLGGFENFVKVEGENQNIRYNVASIFYNESNNNIADVWRNILPKNTYEMFARCDNGEPKIIVRQVPFGDPESNYIDWRNLDLYVISPISLTAYDLEQNDENVYTAFSSYVIGSAKSRQFYQAVSQEGPDDIVRYNDEKVRIYGFRPLEIDFMGYDRRRNTENNNIDPLTKAIQKLNELAAYWYGRNDDMYSGSLTLCTDFKKVEMNPKIGCRAKFLGGEFYINKTEHTWTYLGTPTIKLSISRGMVYSDNGKMRDGEGGIVSNVGSKYKELEKV